MEWQVKILDHKRLLFQVWHSLKAILLSAILNVTFPFFFLVRCSWGFSGCTSLEVCILERLLYSRISQGRIFYFFLRCGCSWIFRTPQFDPLVEILLAFYESIINRCPNNTQVLETRNITIVANSITTELSLDLELLSFLTVLKLRPNLNCYDPSILDGIAPLFSRMRSYLAFIVR